MRMVRDHRYKYVYNPTAEMDELYDLQTDPGELQNLIDDPARKEEIMRLKKALWDWMKEIGDPLANFWTDVHLLGADSQAQRAGLMD
jgi:arylsulfatase A-like enzyme